MKKLTEKLSEKNISHIKQKVFELSIDQQKFTWKLSGAITIVIENLGHTIEGLEFYHETARGRNGLRTNLVN